MTFYIESIGVSGPGLDSWQELCAILRGEKSYQYQHMTAVKPTLLPANERRRTTPLIKLALKVGEEAMSAATLAPDSVASVFSSSEGDTGIIDKICTALNLDGKPVSPTQFHNSVHNAPAGYWAIGTGSRRFSSSIAAADAGFATGMLETIALVACENQPTILICYDESMPESFAGKSYVKEAGAVALLITPERTESSLAGFDVMVMDISESAVNASREVDDNASWLESMQNMNPAFNALPLLSLIAQQQAGEVMLSNHQQALKVVIEPC